MCCGDDEKLGLPPAVIEMLARYRRMRDRQGYGWGEEGLPDFFRWARFSLLGPAFDEFAASGDWSAAVRAAVGDEVPAGLLLVSVGAGGRLSARGGPPRPVIVGSAVPVDVVLTRTRTPTWWSRSPGCRFRYPPAAPGCTRWTSTPRPRPCR